MFYAVDNLGKRIEFEQICDGNSVFLTLKKETFSDAKTIEIFSDSISANAGDKGFYIVPRDINLMGDIYTEFTERKDTEFTVYKPIMACCAVKTKSFCGLIRFERNYCPAFKIKVENNSYNLSLVYDFTEGEDLNNPQAINTVAYRSRDKIYDDIRIEIVKLPDAKTPGDFAKAEREVRLNRGEITTLKEKCQREAVEYARKHPLVRIRLAWKESPSPIKHQTVENEPMIHTAVSFARVRDIADELKKQGVEGADLQLVGWNKSGHDGRYPQLFPVEPQLGGEKELRKTIEYVKSLGYRISLHTNLINAYEIADCFNWDDICVKRGGGYIQRGDFGGGYSYIVCPKKQYEINKWHIQKVKELGVNGMHFIDVMSIVNPDVCHSEEHPCTTKEGIEISQKIMKETQETLGAFSSEGAFDFAIPNLDYGLYVCFGDGFSSTQIDVCDNVIPFYELTYHGILLYNPMSPTVNYTIKNTRDKLFFFLRGGRPSFYIHSRFRADGSDWMGLNDLSVDSNESLEFSAKAIADGERMYKDLADRQFIYMKDYYIKGDGIETAIYEDGVSIVGNFSSEDKAYNGHTVPAGDFIIIK